MTCFYGCLCELHYGITCFLLQMRKKFAKWHVYFSLLVQEQTVLLCSLEIPLFSSCDLTCFSFFEFILPKKKIYPSAITMTKSLCYHHRMTIFQIN